MGSPHSPTLPHAAIFDWFEPCRGRPDRLLPWLQVTPSRLGACLVMICVGGGLYGASLGLMRGPLQAVYSAIKLPLLLFLVTGGNALLNGMLAQVLGLRISFRQSFMAILLSFAIFSVLLGSLSPVTFFLLSSLPVEGTGSLIAYYQFKWLHTLLIAFAGVVSNIRLFHLLTNVCGDLTKSRQALFCWLCGNLLLGSQLSWILRPFFGNPKLEIQFFRDDALEGNFFEALYTAWQQMF